jgi:hypothetical protein
MDVFAASAVLALNSSRMLTEHTRCDYYLSLNARPPSAARSGANLD